MSWQSGHHHQLSHAQSKVTFRVVEAPSSALKNARIDTEILPIV